MNGSSSPCRARCTPLCAGSLLFVDIFVPLVFGAFTSVTLFSVVCGIVAGKPIDQPRISVALVSELRLQFIPEARDREIASAEPPPGTPHPLRVAGLYPKSDDPQGLSSNFQPSTTPAVSSRTRSGKCDFDAPVLRT